MDDAVDAVAATAHPMPAMQYIAYSIPARRKYFYFLQVVNPGLVVCIYELQCLETHSR